MTNHILRPLPSLSLACPVLRSSALPLLVPVVFPVIASAQGMLPGCQLGSTEASSGVPAIEHRPEQQIKILRQAISAGTGDRGWESINR